MSTINTTKESPLFHKLQTAKETESSPLRTARIVTQTAPVIGYGAGQAEGGERCPGHRAMSKMFRDPREDGLNERAFIVSWVDYCIKYGIIYRRKSYPVSEFTQDLKNKMFLLKHFERSIVDRLYGDYECMFENLDWTRGMDPVQKYLRTKLVIVFKMSHEVLQGLLVTDINNNYKSTRYTSSEVMARSRGGGCRAGQVLAMVGGKTPVVQGGVDEHTE
ncbi:hypothetical protein HD554DRAFT_2037836 [Boletus coccyginus]|nr:hypothetical protein HD554DRAFT_2037836 [Boletus coccyginus]